MSQNSADGNIPNFYSTYILQAVSGILWKQQLYVCHVRQRVCDVL